MVKRCSRFGQMALEFTMTYGWAMLLILVSFSGLAYLGVFEGDTYIQPYCSLDGSLACSDFFMTMRSTDEFILDMNLVNNLDERANISSVRLQAVDGTSFCLSSKITDLNDDDTNFVLAPKGGGDDIRFVFIDGVDCSFTDAQFNDALDSKTKYLLEVYYIPGSGTKQVVSTGSIIARTRFNDTAAPPPPPPPSHCLDGDFGPDFFNASYVSSNTGTDNDICDGFGVLTEYICDTNNISQSVTHNCTLADQVCIDGLCYTPSTPCYETDGGNHPEIFGETTDEYGTAYDSCLPNGNYLNEYYCVGNLKYLEEVSCTWGCDTTADECYSAPPSGSCNDSDGGRVYTVFGRTQNDTSGAEDICKDGFSLTEFYCPVTGTAILNETISCLDKGYEICKYGTCIGTAACVDSDNGLVFDTFGKTGGSTVKLDSCSGDILTEWTCDGAVPVSMTYDCSSVGGTCSGGQCVDPVTSCPAGTQFVNGECWLNGGLGIYCSTACESVGLTCAVGSFNDGSSCSVCKTLGGLSLPPSCGSTSSLAPFYKSSTNDCFYLSGTNYPSCGQQSPIVNRFCVCEDSNPPACVDSDHGHNYTVAGNVTVGGIVDMDICHVDADRLIEFFCDGDVSTSEGVVCTGLGFPGGCVDGGCVEASTVVCPDGTTQIDGKCWTLGAAGKSCDETCVKYEGASCVAEDWNDDASCSVCSTFGGSGCTAGTYTYAPGIIAFSTSCFYRETVHQNCGASTPGIQRLCVCE